MVVRGPPGVGKTSLAAALCCHSGSRVLSYHFCDAANADSRDPCVIVRSLAYRLACNFRGYRDQLCAAFSGAALELQRGGGAVPARGSALTGASTATWSSGRVGSIVQLGSPLELFNALLVEPLLKVAPPANARVIVVVDGVDVDTTLSNNLFLQVRQPGRGCYTNATHAYYVPPESSFIGVRGFNLILVSPSPA